MLAQALPESVKALHIVRSTIPESVGKLVNAASPQFSKIQTRVSSALEEDLFSVPNQKCPVPPQVWNLFDCGQYIPLTIFTSKSMKILHQDPSSCTMKNISILNEGNKIPILNVGPSSGEKDMSIPDWHGAKANYKTFLLKALNDGVAGQWI
jgi:hypothetical protein